MTKTHGTIPTVLEQLKTAEYGSHYLIIYPDVTTLRELYTHYTKTQLEENHEIVVLIPYYETWRTTSHTCCMTRCSAGQ
jgi:hypothetical protein